jgi:hypothetical protein
MPIIAVDSLLGFPLLRGELGEKAAAQQNRFTVAEKGFFPNSVLNAEQKHKCPPFAK